MPDLPIAPDESGDVPRCRDSCPHCESAPMATYVLCSLERTQTLRRAPCLPRIRELVALSRQRCDGCPRYVEDARAYPSDGRCSKRGCTTMAHDCCSRWEAKR